MNLARHTVRGGSGSGQQADFGSAPHCGQVMFAQAQSAICSLLGPGGFFLRRVAMFTA
jgi:hypothetical protein